VVGLRREKSLLAFHDEPWFYATKSLPASIRNRLPTSRRMSDPSPTADAPTHRHFERSKPTPSLPTLLLQSGQPAERNLSLVFDEPDTAGAKEEKSKPARFENREACGTPLYADVQGFAIRL
jgi:hypothetical protein